MCPFRLCFLFLVSVCVCTCLCVCIHVHVSVSTQTHIPLITILSLSFRTNVLLIQTPDPIPDPILSLILISEKQCKNQTTSSSTKSSCTKLKAIPTTPQTINAYLVSDLAADRFQDPLLFLGERHVGGQAYPFSRQQLFLFICQTQLWELHTHSLQLPVLNRTLLR